MASLQPVLHRGLRHLGDLLGPRRRYLGGCGAWGVYWDFAAGIAGWGSHTIIQCQAAADALNTAPVHYAYPGNLSGDGLVARFADGVKLVMSFGGWRGSCGVRFEGDEGWTSIADGYSRPDLSSPRLLSEFGRLTSQYAAREGRPFSHIEDFIACVRSRRQPIANAEVMQQTVFEIIDPAANHQSLATLPGLANYRQLGCIAHLLHHIELTQAPPAQVCIGDRIELLAVLIAH